MKVMPVCLRMFLIVDEGPGDGDPLLLTAGQRRNVALFEAAQVDEPQHLLYLRLDLLLRAFCHPQAEGNVLVDI